MGHAELTINRDRRMKPLMYILAGTVGLLCGGERAALAQRPVTQVEVVRPTTQVQVTRPTTQVTVSRPITQVTVNRPVTQTAVTRPVTTATVSRPTTEVSVTRPVTPVVVFRPTTPSGENAASAGSAGKSAAGVSSAAAKTSMSDYKPPVAKDFKAPASAAQLVGGAAGLGNKTNESEKDAAAAALQTPSAQNPNTVSAQQVIGNQQAVKGNALELLQKKAQDQQKAAQKK